MDFLVHGMMSAIPAHKWKLPMFWVTIIFVVGMMPDVIAYWETRHGIYDNLYRITHTFDWWMVVISPWGLHVITDILTHAPEGGWYWWTYVVDVVAWLAIIWYWIFYVGIFVHKEKERH